MSGRGISVRFGVAGLVAACALAVSACGGSSEKFLKTEQDVVLVVRDAANEPVGGVTAKLWILDLDVAPDARDPIPLEAQPTNFEGLAMWQYLAYETPAICGFEIRDENDVVLKTSAPSTANVLNVMPGRLTVTLD